MSRPLEEGAEELEGPVPQLHAIQPIRDPADEPFAFRFELGPAILQQLLSKLRSLEPQPLEDALDARHPGFYQLFLDGKPVYIGKTSRTIGERLREHARKLRGRIELGRMTCRFAYVEDPSLVDLSEGALIRFFDALGATEWNHSGFGSKVTGYGRTGQDTSSWGALYPPDLDWPVGLGSERPLTLRQIIGRLNRGAPITFSLPRRFRSAFDEAHPEPILLPPATRPFSEWAAWIEERLAPGWRVRRTRTGWYVEPRP